MVRLGGALKKIICATFLSGQFRKKDKIIGLGFTGKTPNLKTNRSEPVLLGSEHAIGFPGRRSSVFLAFFILKGKK